jgi:hypothetical protein
LNNSTGSNNTAVGVGAGSSLSTGDNNIDIGNSGVDGESDTICIGSEFQKVSAQLEVSRPAPQTVLNNR